MPMLKPSWEYHMPRILKKQENQQRKRSSRMGQRVAPIATPEPAHSERNTDAKVTGSDSKNLVQRLETKVIGEAEWLEEEACCRRVRAVGPILARGIEKAHEKISARPCLLKPWLCIILYIYRLPLALMSYFSVAFAPELMCFTLVLDLWDTATDVLLVSQARNESAGYQAWLIIALFLGAWNLIYEILWMFQPRAAMVQFRAFTVLGITTLNSERRKLAGFGTGTWVMFGRCVSEDGLVMVAALLRGEKITGTAEQIAFATSLTFIALCILQMLGVICWTYARSFSKLSNDRWKDCAEVSVVITSFCVYMTCIGVTLTLWCNFIFLFWEESQYNAIEKAFLHLAGVAVVFMACVSLGVFQTILPGTPVNSTEFAPSMAITNIDEECALCFDCEAESEDNIEKRRKFEVAACIHLLDAVSDDPAVAVRCC
eukprot:CAMPEP_0170186636 /NCGR_PEP_ID=MMETSP0040_2-20121228/39783_1 /TAXON_ID=641309 /ORGANISM="Lotharella oceanica, Strain CCMP622" /LENGTH=429 /DNA_ID=CAMNT_0010433461 /DNA_START=80 /DNA_END=1369 /DNA_ORIENTATION=+